MNVDKLIPQKIEFNKSISNHKNLLNNNILDSNVLVIGGAGTIGSSYIKQLLKYKPSKITVVDINENGLTESFFCVFLPSRFPVNG